MKILALEASANNVSIAIQHGLNRVHDEMPSNSKSSSWLIPRIMQLLRDSNLHLEELDSIAFGRGPCAFTGLRTVCSVVQGLTLGLGLELQPSVLGLDTLMELAQDAFNKTQFTSKGESKAQRFLSVLDARMDQWYVGAYERIDEKWSTIRRPVVCSPFQLEIPESWEGLDFFVAGNINTSLLAEVFKIKNITSLASFLVSSPHACLCLDLAMMHSNIIDLQIERLATPLYIRDRVALTTVERETLKSSTSSS